MIRTRVFALGASAISVSTAMLVACGGAEPRTSSVDEPDGANAPEASAPPVEHDAGTRNDGDAAPSKPDYDASDEPVVCTSTPCVTQLVAGADHFCALLDDGRIRCWGLNYFGSLGRGETVVEGSIGSTPMPVVGITNATQISASSTGYTTCARDDGGRVQCWGANDSGQLGLQPSPAIVDYGEHATPVAVALTDEIARVDVGPVSVCALGPSGAVFCWGRNEYGQLARPDASSSSTYEGPGLADLRGYDVTRIVSGSASVFGLTKDGQLLGWGIPSGRDSSLEYTSRPFPLPTLSDVTTVATGDSFSCAIARGNVHCWGTNSYGQLGTGFPSHERYPAIAAVLTDGGTFPQQLALSGQGPLSGSRSCVRMTDGAIQCCGGGDGFGQLGRGDAGPITSPCERAVALEEPAVQVAINGSATCALIQGGKVMCWGANYYGQLGQGTSDLVAHPLPVTVVFE